MRQARIRTFGGPEVLEVVETEPQALRPGEVRVHVQASSLTFTDLLIRRGLYPMLKQRPPLTLGYAFVGEVIEVDDAHSHLRGRRVASLTQVGSNTEQIVLPAEMLESVPVGLDSAEAEAMVLSGASAYQALVRVANVSRGSKVLVTGATGAVGHLAVQVALAIGAEVVGLASARRMKDVAALGATAVNYDQPDAEKQLQDLGPYDAIIDLAGKWSPSRTRRLLNPQGTLVVLGFRSVWKSAPSHPSRIARDRLQLLVSFLHTVLLGRTRTRRVRLYSIADLRIEHRDWYSEDLAALFGMLGRGQIKPWIDARIPLAQISEGHARIEEGSVRGRLTVVP